HWKEGMVRRWRSWPVADVVGATGDQSHHWIGIREHFVLETKRMQSPPSICQCRVRDSADKRLHECAIQRQVRLRHAIRRGETAIVRYIVTAECANVIERAHLASHDPVAAGEIRIDGCARLALA